MAKATCSIDGCSNPVLSRTWCAKHYQRWRNHGDPTFSVFEQPKPLCIVEGCDRIGVSRQMCHTHYASWRRRVGVRSCSIDGCDRPHFGRGWCELHYERWERQGDPTIVTVIVGDDETRFWSHVDRRDEHQCWPWTSTITDEGYGVFQVGGRQVKAHRYSYELEHGPIPDGLDLDHQCHNRDAGCHANAACLHRRCVNPAHAEPVTKAINSARAHAHRRRRTSPLP